MPETFIVHARLMREAIEQATGRARENIGHAVEGLRRQVDQEVQWAAQMAYQQGVRDGYVQAVSTEPDDLKRGTE